MGSVFGICHSQPPDDYYILVFEFTFFLGGEGKYSIGLELTRKVRLNALPPPPGLLFAKIFHQPGK